MSDYGESIYKSELIKLLNNEKFYEVDAENHWKLINGFNQLFKEKTPSFFENGELTERRMLEICAETGNEYKKMLNKDKFIPGESDVNILYEKFTPKFGAWNGVVSNIESWHSKSLEKAEKVRPFDFYDIRDHLKLLENQYIREAAGHSTSYLADKFFRYCEGVITPPMSLLGSSMSNRLLAEYIPESPRYDKLTESKTIYNLGLFTFYFLLIILLIKQVAKIKRFWNNL